MQYILPDMVKARKRINKNTEIIRYSLPNEYIGLGKGKYYHLKTYGCQGNLADSEKISGLLQKIGYMPVDNDEQADLIIFNTCAIRENAHDKVFGLDALSLGQVGIALGLSFTTVIVMEIFKLFGYKKK